MNKKTLWDMVNLYLGELLKNVNMKEQILMKAAIGMITLSEGGKVVIKSGIVNDIGDWEEVYTRQTIEETIIEFHDKKNWQKWKRIAPALIADLEKSEEIAKEVAKKYGVNLRMVVDRTRANFVTEIDGRGLGDDELLRRTYMNVDAMFTAWGLFVTWLYGKERLKIVKSNTNRSIR